MWFFLSLLVILVSFEFINVIIIGTFWFLLGMWCFCVSMFLCFLCFSCQKPVKKNCGIPVLLNVLQAANTFSKVSLNFNKILNYVRQVLQTYSAYAFFCLLQKKSPPEAVDKDWSQSATDILWWNWWQCDEIHITVNLG